MILFKVEAILASSISKFGNLYPQSIAMTSVHPLDWPSPLLLIHNTASEGKSEQELTCVLNLILQHENNGKEEELIEQKDICGLCCAAVEFCGTSACKEFMVDGLLTHIGIGVVLPIRSHWNRTCGTWIRRVKNSLTRCLCWIEHRSGIAKKRFPVFQTKSMCQMACFGCCST